MNEKIFVRPKPGRTVPNFTRSDYRPLAAEGELVENDPQWIRYQTAGDVDIESEAPKIKPSKKGEE